MSGFKKKYVDVESVNQIVVKALPEKVLRRSTSLEREASLIM